MSDIPATFSFCQFFFSDTRACTCTHKCTCTHTYILILTLTYAKCIPEVSVSCFSENTREREWKKKGKKRQTLSAGLSVCLFDFFAKNSDIKWNTDYPALGVHFWVFALSRMCSLAFLLCLFLYLITSVCACVRVCARVCVCVCVCVCCGSRARGRGSICICWHVGRHMHM